MYIFKHLQSVSTLYSFSLLGILWGFLRKFQIHLYLFEIITYNLRILISRFDKIKFSGYHGPEEKFDEYLDEINSQMHFPNGMVLQKEDIVDNPGLLQTSAFIFKILKYLDYFSLFRI